MKTNDLFLQAKKDKNLRAFLVIQRKEETDRTYIRLCLDVPVKFSDRKESVFVETDTEIRVDNYSGRNGGKKEPIEISFYESVYPTCGPGHISTFLNAIKKDSDVKFRIVAWSASDNLRNVGFTQHILYGRIDDKEYLLSTYVGPENSASPVKY